MCHAITREGIRLLEARGASSPLAADEASLPDARRLDVLRRGIRASGWALALSSHSRRPPVLFGRAASVRHPPGAGGRAHPFGPNDLRLPGGRVAHDFLCTDALGVRAEVDRFETIRPDGTVVLERGPGVPAMELLFDLDDRAGGGRWTAKLERYDHYLSGWSMQAHGHGQSAQPTSLVVFVCRDRARARRCAEQADPILVACRAYAGEYPLAWQYPGRDRILFVGERDAHEGLLHAYGLQPLPPAVRVGAAHEDPRAGEAVPTLCEISRSGLEG
jgi:hypothetical protein